MCWLQHFGVGPLIVARLQNYFCQGQPEQECKSKDYSMLENAQTIWNLNYMKQYAFLVLKTLFLLLGYNVQVILSILFTTLLVQSLDCSELSVVLSMLTLAIFLLLSLQLFGVFRSGVGSCFSPRNQLSPLISITCNSQGFGPRSYSKFLQFCVSPCPLHAFSLSLPSSTNVRVVCFFLHL